MGLKPCIYIITKVEMITQWKGVSMYKRENDICLYVLRSNSHLDK